MTPRDVTERVRLLRLSSKLAVDGVESVVERMGETTAAGVQASRALRYEARASQRDSHQRITPIQMPAQVPDTDTVPGPPADEVDDEK